MYDDVAGRGNPDGGLAAEHVTVGAAAGGALKKETLQFDICCPINVDQTLELGDCHFEIFVLSSNSIGLRKGLKRGPKMDS